MKLGDFGLSKLLGSHDFASTYVGTPFYMSPEICAGEKYTLHSDIWAVGCIMYELCMREPPFNARTHIQLVQKIREGRYPPLPDIYSPELKSVIANCLRVNPDHRPDTASLLKLPVIRLMRKEKEVVDLERTLRTKEETALLKLKEIELRCAQFDKERAALKMEIENIVRREWEVKARLEIDRQVQNELEALRKRFDAEVQEKVAAELYKIRLFQSQPQQEDDSTSSSTDISRSSVGTDDTDLSSLSLESPSSDQGKLVKKYNRTPFSRAKTTLESPMDIQMAEPSPMSIASLSLSPRRINLGSTARNIFADGGRKVPKWDSALMYSDDEEDIPDLPSPTRPQVKADPFKAPHRPLLRQNTTAMMQKLSSQPSLFPSKATGQTASSNAPSQPEPRTTETRPKSPHRRLSKIPSCTSLALDGGSPVRRAAIKAPSSKANAGGEEMFKAVMQRNMGGRTLVELAQARAGGRPIEELKRPGESRMLASGPIAAKPVERDPPATWDPEKDEMPSPFLARGTKILRNLR